MREKATYPPTPAHFLPANPFARGARNTSGGVPNFRAADGGRGARRLSPSRKRGPSPETSPSRKRGPSPETSPARAFLAIPCSLFLAGFYFYSGRFASPTQECLLAAVSVVATLLLYLLTRNYMVLSVAGSLAVVFLSSGYIWQVFLGHTTLLKILSFVEAFDIGLVWFFSFLTLVTIRLFTTGRWDQKKDRATFRRAFHVSAIVFLVIYVLLLIWLFVTMRPIGFGGERSLNLIPFKGAFATYWPHIRRGEFHNDIFIQFFGNLLIFTPLGFFLRVYGKKMPAPIYILIPIVLSGAIEATQYIFRMGKSDIDDFWMNVVGYCVGAGIYLALGLIRRAVTKGSERNIC